MKVLWKRWLVASSNVDQSVWTACGERGVNGVLAPIVTVSESLGSKTQLAHLPFTILRQGSRVWHVDFEQSGATDHGSLHK